MNDHELDRLVASVARARAGWVDGHDLRDAEHELMEEIMATPRTDEADEADRADLDPSPATPLAGAAGTYPPARSGRSGRRSATTARRRVPVAAAVGLAAALLAGVVLVRVSGGGGDGADVVTPAEGAVAPMVVDPVPEGFSVTSAGDQGEPPPDDWVDTWVYGRLDATAIADDVVLSVAPAAPFPLDAVADGTLGEPVTVRGEPAIVCSPGPLACDFGGEVIGDVTGVSWTEAPGAYVTVESRTFDRAQLLAIAEGVVVEPGDDGPTVALGDLPVGVTAPPLLTEADSARGDTYSIGYSDGGIGMLSVATTSETEASHILDLWRSGPRDDAQVQGQDAAVGAVGSMWRVAWEDTPGVLVELLVQGGDRAGALALAETVRPASDAEWAAAQAEAGTAPTGGVLDEPIPDGAAHRTTAGPAGDVELWSYLGEDGELCYRLDHGDGGGSELCDPAGTVLGISPRNEGGELFWDVKAVVGIAPAGTGSIDGGDVTFGGDVDGGALFVWEFAAGEMPDTITFRDAAGAEIATVPVVVY